MGLNETPSGERITIGFFGRCNVGKSSVVNAVTGQDLAVVSQVSGTTTDPVSKAMEILPLGPVMIIDTPGFDDNGELGELRIEKTKKILRRTDIAVLVIDETQGLQPLDEYLVNLFKEKNIRYIIAHNKCDKLAALPANTLNDVYVSALTGAGIDCLKNKLGQFAAKNDERRLIGDLLHPGQLVVLVTPIDEAAPKGRLILPQQQTLRDILDADCRAVVIKEDAVKDIFADLAVVPAMVVTDSQVFEQVAKDVPDQVPLTSFSILMARYKGFLKAAVDGVKYIEKLHDGDRILIAEGCTHHRQCGDIGTVKIPGWLKKHTGKELEIVPCSGGDFPQDLSAYAMVIHCGGCMLSGREVEFRMKLAADQNVPFTNYGTVIAYMKGILPRALQIFSGDNM